MEKLKKINARIEKLVNERKEITNKLDRFNYSTYGEYKNACGGDEGIAALQDKKIELSIKIKLLNNNAIYSFYDEINPALFDVFKKYSGKKCGPKTAEAMKEDFKKTTGHRFYFDGYREIHILYINSQGFHNCGDLEIDLSGLYDSETKETFYFLNNNNEICAPTEKNIIICNGSKFGYVENINAQTQKIIKSYEEVKKARKKFDAAIKNYNNSIPGNMGDLWLNSTIYDRINL